MTTLFTRIPSLNHSCTLLCNAGDDLGTASKDDEHHRLSRCQQFLHILFLLSWQAKTLTVAILTAKHHILTHCSDNHISLLS